MTGPPGNREGVANTEIRVVTRETVRSARYASIGASPERARRVWFALHGYGQLAARFLRPFAGIVPDDTMVVAPEGLSRFYLEMPNPDGSHLQRVGATWMTREGRELDIADTVRWLDVVYDDVMGPSLQRGKPVVCGVLGFSQGVATASRWVADGAIRPASFVAWAGSLASDVQHERFASRLAGCTVTMVTGEDDRFVTPALHDAALRGMRGYHADVRQIRFAGEHALDPGVLTMLLNELPTDD
jgi:predicted esterase